MSYYCVIDTINSTQTHTIYLSQEHTASWDKGTVRQHRTGFYNLATQTIIPIL